MATINLPFAAGAVRRPPSNDELVNGYPCGSADQELFNWMGWWTTGQIDKVIELAGLPTSDTDLTNLHSALRKMAPIIFQSVTLNVATTGSATPADPFAGDAFNRLSAALDWLRGWRIQPGAMVTISLAGQTFTESGDFIDLSHPDGLNIQIIGAGMSGAFPLISDFSGTKATDEAMLRARWATKIECAADGLIVGRAGLRLIRDILFIGTQTTGKNGIYVGTNADFTPATFGGDGAASTSAMRCWWHNFNNGILVRAGGVLSGYNIGASYNLSIGALVNNGSYFYASGLISTRNGAEGVYGRDDSFIELEGITRIQRNTAQGLRLSNKSGACLISGATANASIAGNGQYNISAEHGSIATIALADLGLDGVSTGSARSQYGSQVFLGSCAAVSNLSPATNTVGNNNSYNLTY